MVRLEEVDDPDEVVVDVPELLLRLGFDLLRVPAGQHRQRLPGRPRQFPERQQVPADGGYLLTGSSWTSLSKVVSPVVSSAVLTKTNV